MSEHALFKKQTCRLGGFLTTHTHFMSQCSYLNVRCGSVEAPRRRRRSAKERKADKRVGKSGRLTTLRSTKYATMMVKNGWMYQ